MNPVKKGESGFKQRIRLKKVNTVINNESGLKKFNTVSNN